MHLFYDRDGEPVDMVTAHRLIVDPDRRLATTTVAGGAVKVMTSFTVIRLDFDSDRPALWETTVEGGPLDERRVQYTSEADAVRGHELVVELARHAAGGGVGEGPGA